MFAGNAEKSGYRHGRRDCPQPQQQPRRLRPARAALADLWQPRDDRLGSCRREFSGGHRHSSPRRQHHRCDDRGVGGTYRRARPRHFHRRRLLHALLRRGERPRHGPQFLGLCAARRDARAVPWRHESARPIGAGGAGSRRRVGDDASPLRQAALARALHRRDRAGRSPSDLGGTRAQHRAEPRDAGERSGLRRALFAGGPAARRRRDAAPARAPPRRCARSPKAAPSLSIAARSRNASTLFSPSAAD